MKKASANLVTDHGSDGLALICQALNSLEESTGLIASDRFDGVNALDETARNRRAVEMSRDSFKKNETISKLSGIKRKNATVMNDTLSMKQPKYFPPCQNFSELEKLDILRQRPSNSATRKHRQRLFSANELLRLPDDASPDKSRNKRNPALSVDRAFPGSDHQTFESLRNNLERKNSLAIYLSQQNIQVLSEEGMRKSSALRSIASDRSAASLIQSSNTFCRDHTYKGDSLQQASRHLWSIQSASKSKRQAAPSAIALADFALKKNEEGVKESISFKSQESITEVRSQGQIENSIPVNTIKNAKIFFSGKHIPSFLFTDLYEKSNIERKISRLQLPALHSSKGGVFVENVLVEHVYPFMLARVSDALEEFLLSFFSGNLAESHFQSECYSWKSDSVDKPEDDLPYNEKVFKAAFKSNGLLLLLPSDSILNFQTNEQLGKDIGCLQCSDYAFSNLADSTLDDQIGHIKMCRGSEDIIRESITFSQHFCDLLCGLLGFKQMATLHKAAAHSESNVSSHATRSAFLRSMGISLKLLRREAQLEQLEQSGGSGGVKISAPFEFSTTVLKNLGIPAEIEMTGSVSCFASSALFDISPGFGHSMLKVDESTIIDSMKIAVDSEKFTRRCNTVASLRFVQLTGMQPL